MPSIHSSPHHHFETDDETENETPKISEEEKTNCQACLVLIPSLRKDCLGLLAITIKLSIEAFYRKVNSYGLGRKGKT